ncbi:integration host factor subunit beta [Loktanella sp. PT4BL]|jgi:integration host factor subunit beta|uniref:HU family DNA-binding protein n=1 Tax=Loktanella sp. PT4BL TaxID=2135611 RepID=UPI000D76705D|nr:HU family DNA-binding protein [Loktanella sp. PT4BL]PXW66255.1 integration host factor subunit beta [Loktanella sp. PT4BL]
MIRSELIARLAAENPHLYRSEIEKVVAAVFDTISTHLAAGGRVELRGFGVFGVRHRSVGRRCNPRTGEIMTLDAKSAPFFRTGKDLHKRLNPDG